MDFARQCAPNKQCGLNNNVCLITRFYGTFVRKVLGNNFQSRNHIGPYNFLETSPKNLTSFNRPFLTERHMWARHKTRRRDGSKPDYQTKRYKFTNLLAPCRPCSLEHCIHTTSNTWRQTHLIKSVMQEPTTTTSGSVAMMISYKCGWRVCW